MKKAIFLFLALTLASIYFSHHKNSNQLYENWKSTFGFEFELQEDIYRSMIFAKNLEIIEKHISDPSQTYKMAVNQFSGLTQQQFVSIMLHDKKVTSTSQTLNIEIQRKQSNANIDWTTKGQVSPVKNQGQCGSCWAFSAVAVLQSLALSKGQTVDLSEQQLVDCSHLYGNLGCEGGQNYEALAYVRDHGITDTQSYPYVAKNQFCKIHGGNFKISHVNSVRGCENLQSAIQQRPVGIAVDATNWSRYASGIFSNCNKKLNHNVLLVGMTDAYYKVKNSWGTTWGEQGFIRLALGNTCGICDDKSPWAE